MRDELIETFRQQSQACGRLGSPLTSHLCERLPALLLDGTALTRHIAGWSAERALADALPLRVTGALHALARSGLAPYLAEAYPPAPLDPGRLCDAVTRAMREHDGFLSSFLVSPPQTNEVARCSALLGAALQIAVHTRLPLAWYEIGASAGLNLAFDQYRYDLHIGSFGETNAPLLIRSRWELAEGAGHGALPDLTATLSVVHRAACDVAPLDPRSPEARERLLSYVWPDQAERLDRTAAALEHAARGPWRVEQEPASSWLPRQILPPREGVVRVLAHTIMWQYLPPDERSAIKATMREAAERATARAPVAWFSMEALPQARGAALQLTVWPGHARRTLGFADFHGRWVRWQT